MLGCGEFAPPPIRDALLVLKVLEPHVEHGATAVLTHTSKRIADGVLDLFRPSHLASKPAPAATAMPQ